MGITIDVTVSTPLSEEDARVLTGVAMLSMTIVNDTLGTVPPTGCGKQDPNRPTFYCVGQPDHEGRHTYRDFGDGEAN